MDRLKRSGRRHSAARQDTDLDGLDFLRDTDEKGSTESRVKSTKKNATPSFSSNPTSAADSNHSKHESGKKEGGWGAESNDMEIVDFRLQRNNSADASAAKNFDAPDEDDDDDIPVIPTLDDMQEQEFSTTIAAAPTAQVRIASMNELENALQKHSAMYTLDGEIDLKSLARAALSPEAEVVEDDRKWEWNILFTQVTSELRADMDKNNSMNNLTSANSNSLPGAESKLKEDTMAELL